MVAEKVIPNFVTKLHFMGMERIRVDKLACHYPALFKVMWIATAVWIVVIIVNYFGHWLAPDKLDGFGMSVLFLFAISLFVCFGKGVMALISQHGILAIDNITKKVASYTFLMSFAVILVSSIWEICGTTDSQTDFTRNGGSLSIPYIAVCSIVSDIVKAAVISIAAVIFYWYVRMYFILFCGRIRRLGVEVAMAMAMLVILSVHVNDNIWINAIVVLIAVAFLYDIWCIADFQETHFSMSQLECLVVKDNNNNNQKDYD